MQYKTEFRSPNYFAATLILKMYGRHWKLSFLLTVSEQTLAPLILLNKEEKILGSEFWSKSIYKIIYND